MTRGWLEDPLVLLQFLLCSFQFGHGFGAKYGESFEKIAEMDSFRN